MARMTDFERMVFETVFSVIFPRVANFTAGSNQTDYVLPGDGYNTTHDVPRVWVNGAEMLSGVSWVDTHTVRLSPGPTLGKNVKILVMPGALTGYLLRGGGLAMTGPLDMGGNPILNVGAGGTATAAAQRQELNLSSLLAGYLLRAGGTMSGVLNMGGNKLQGVADGVAATDAASVGQVNNSVPAGAVFALASTTIPNGYLLCDGQAVSRTTYARLFAAIQTLHGIGDGTTSFNVPDYRGYFLRGLTSDPAIDPDGASRGIGSTQIDAFQSHKHRFRFMTEDGSGGTERGVADDSSQFLNRNDMVDIPIEHTDYGAVRTAKETRPRNKAVHFIIKT